MHEHSPPTTGFGTSWDSGFMFLSPGSLAALPVPPVPSEQLWTPHKY